MREVFTVIKPTAKEKNRKPFWQKVGLAFENSDGSLNVLLNCLPIDGKLHIRPERKED